MSKDFYEKECLPRVKRIAQEINRLSESEFTDRDEAEAHAAELETLIENAEGEELTELQGELNDLREALDNGEAFNLYEYFADCLDIEYRISGRGDYRGVRIAVTLGGPNIYVDTKAATVSLYWGSDRAEAYITRESRDQIDDIFEEYYLALC